MSAHATTGPALLQAPPSVEELVRADEGKELVRLVVIGSVDDGKSTLIGRLLHDAHAVYEDHLAAVKRASKTGATATGDSASEIDFSLFTDGLAAEREQGITIDVAYRYFATGKRKFVIADTPGHVQYTRNMATGASTADVAVILVDARLGVLPQTRRHAHIAALLGIRHVIVCVNKMDLVAFDRETFERIAGELADTARELGVPELVAIPLSALAGDNVVRASARTPWWAGSALLTHLESLASGVSRRGAPLRMPVQLVLRPSLDYRGFAGTIASGEVRAGDEVVLLPSGRRTRIASVEVAGALASVASASMSVTLRLTDEMDLSRGDTIASPSNPPTVGADFEADLVWMSEQPLDFARVYVVKHTTRNVRASFELVGRIEPGHLAPRLPGEGAGVLPLALNDIGRVAVRCRAPLAFDSYAVNRTTGAFIVIDPRSNDTVAAGMIRAPLAPFARAREDREVDDEAFASEVPPATRRARLGQDGAALSVRGPSLAEALAFGRELEVALFAEGFAATLANSRLMAEACARGGLVAVHAAEDASIAELQVELPWTDEPTSARHPHEVAARCALFLHRAQREDA